LAYIIDLNIKGIKDEVLDLILGKKISIKLSIFGTKDLLEKSEKK